MRGPRMSPATEFLTWQTRRGSTVAVVASGQLQWILWIPGRSSRAETPGVGNPQGIARPRKPTPRSLRSVALEAELPRDTHTTHT